MSEQKKLPVSGLIARILGGLNAGPQILFLMLTLDNPFGGGNPQRAKFMSVWLLLGLLGYVLAWKKPAFGGIAMVFSGVAILVTYFITADPEALTSTLTPFYLNLPTILIGALFIYSSR
ncbi:MAG: DUF7670 domain-containing protein [Calditrichia bacterium]